MLTQQLPAAFSSRLRREDGQDVVEHGPIIALIAVVVIGVLTALGNQVDTMFCSVWTTPGGAGSCP